jgi:transposase
MSVHGIVGVYETSGTFNRNCFVECIIDLIASKKVRKGTVFVMDGARIHLDTNIVHYFRSFSAYIIFLPVYCPFYNPIEIMFSQVKSQLQKKYSERPR